MKKSFLKHLFGTWSRIIAIPFLSVISVISFLLGRNGETGATFTGVFFLTILLVLIVGEFFEWRSQK